MSAEDKKIAGRISTPFKTGNRAQYGVNVGTDVLGIPGTNGDGGSNGDIRASGMPSFFIAGYEGLGGVDGWTPIFRNDRTYNLSTNLTFAPHGRWPIVSKPLFA